MKYDWNIEFKNAGLTYPNGKEALKNINLRINEGEMVAIIGLSGAGKTTLLKTINKLQDITTGELYVGDTSKEAIEDYKQVKNAFLEEQKRFEQFVKAKKLTKKDVDVLSQDLVKEIKGRKKVIVSLENKIAKYKEKIQKHEANAEKFLKEVKGPANMAAPFKHEVKKINKEISLLTKSIARKNADLANVEKDNKSLISMVGSWEKNKDVVLKIITKRLKSRVNYFKKEYLEHKQHKPYYDVKKIKGKQARRYKSNIGMVFQRYNLIYKASVLNNAMSGRLSKMPWWRAITGIWSKKDKERAFDALADVNILEAAYSRAEELSGGQMQRVALARTITQEARLFLADEPVGALDPIMAKSVMDSFLEINKRTNRTIIMNLHHVDLAITYADRIIGVKDGSIVFDGHSEEVDFKVLKKIYGNKLEGFDDHELKEIMRKRKLIKG